ncbi:MAG: M20/M25/M40 family metallo-hydrolase, partial [Candidatus Marinimicrobia bacterium]|nr:M20/M25/M40 family metallo-hydrolase [Candidatus Neomarinimicrobiota bacterium]
MRKTYKVIFFTTFLSIAFSVEQPKSINATKTWVNRNGHKIIKDFVKLLSIPNVASDTVSIRKNAEYISSLFEKRNFKMKLLELEKANPIIYGELKTPGAKRTLCFYVHYDGQPVNESKWAHEPFKPILYDGPIDAGGKPIRIPKNNNDIDPEWRLYARSAGDDKAPILTILNAIDAL